MILNSPYISGSSTITGNLLVLGNITGSTNSAISASYANNATSASYALNATSASYALVATSASYTANADLLDGRDSLTFANIKNELKPFMKKGNDVLDKVYNEHLEIYKSLKNIKI